MRDQVDTTGDYLSRFLENVIDALPAIVGALIILIISYFVAKALATATHKILDGVRLNDRLHAGQGGNYIQRAIPNPSSFVSKLVYWIVFLFGVSIAASALGIPIINDFLRAIYGYIPNIIAAITIFMVASTISAGVVALVRNTMGDTPTGKVVATSVPIIVMSIAVFMILNQLKIAPEIVTITYAALLGSASLGMALAFGLGGRDVASKILGDLYVKGQQSKVQAKHDIQQGAARAKRQARNNLP